MYKLLMSNFLRFNTPKIIKNRLIFTARRSYRGLGSRNSVRPSVSPSVRLSVTRVLCD